MKSKLLLAILLSTLNYPLSTVLAQGTAFTYQGQLKAGSGPANGFYDLVFGVFDAATGGSALANQTNSAIGVTNGLFTTVLDLGPGIFTGPDRWLEIQARTNGSGGFALLTPRQKLTATPYAITAGNVSGVVPSGSIAGGYSNAVAFNNLANSFSGSFAGNGGGLSNVNAQTLGGLPPSSFWQLTGNNVAPGQFLGSTNDQPVEFKANGQRALRLEPNTYAAPNVIAGAGINVVDLGIKGATISGGGAANYFGYAYSNRVSSDFGTIGGGLGNLISGNGYIGVISGGYGNTNDGAYSFIGAGFFNRIEFSTNYYPAAIVGGLGNTIRADNENSAIVGGIYNVLENAAAWSFIGGGGYNDIKAGSFASSILGGVINTNGSSYSVIVDGYQNYIQTNSAFSIIGGGQQNTIESAAGFSTIGGGLQNAIRTGGGQSFIGGGWGNQVQSGSDQSTVAGGNSDIIESNARESFIGGGFANMIRSNSAFSFIGAGTGNRIGTNSLWGTIPGGQDNWIQTGGDHSAIGGGIGNSIAGQYGTIAGGSGNSISNTAGYSTIGGGYQNTATNNYATVGGGYQNLASGNVNGTGDSATVAGGYQNAALGNNAAVGGGASNRGQGDNTVIAGGAFNTNQTGYGFIGGGNQNFLESFTRFSAIPGGDRNTVRSNSPYSAISGGQLNVIGTNAAFGMILGGVSNEVNATNGLAAGHRAKADHQGSFVWADSTEADFASTTSNQFNIRATGGLRIDVGGGSGTLNGQPILSGSVGTSQIQDNAVTAAKIGSGQVVKSLNGLKDAVNLTAGPNLTITPSGNNLQLNLKPSSTLTNDNTTSYAFKGYAPSGFWAGPIGLWGQGGVAAAVGPNLPAGIFGESGEANGIGVWGVSTGSAATSAGVYGRGFSSTTGVYGQSDTGNGVVGRTTGTGSAVVGENTDSTGYAGNFNGNVRATGTMSLGIGTGTTQSPDKPIIIRRLNSTMATVGNVVARTDKLTLQRDGTSAGWRIVNVAGPGNTTIAATGLTATGATVNFVLSLPGSATAGTNTVFTDAQNVVSLRCSFGDSYSPGDMTEVSAMRYPGDYFWTGTLTSTFNQ